MIKSDLEQEALGLAPDDRVALAQTLLLSLEEMTQDEIREKWLKVAANREDELDSGEVKAIPYDQVLADANRY